MLTEDARIALAGRRGGVSTDGRRLAQLLSRGRPRSMTKTQWELIKAMAVCPDTPDMDRYGVTGSPHSGPES